MVDAKDDAPLAAKPEEPKPKAVTEKEAPKPPKGRSRGAASPAQRRKPRSRSPRLEKPKEAEAKKEPLPKRRRRSRKSPRTSRSPSPRLRPRQKHDFNADGSRRCSTRSPMRRRSRGWIDAPQDAPRKPVKGQSSGTQTTMSVNEIDALRAKIAQCWSPPPGGLGADAIIIKLRLQLNEDGSLIGYPTVANSGGSPFFQAAADSAVRAVFQCQPYELAKREIRGLARHDPQFRPKTDVWQRLGCLIATAIRTHDRPHPLLRYSSGALGGLPPLLLCAGHRRRHRLRHGTRGG